ncbi:hypothetical protein [Aureibacillus halotolerans]|uniref:Uncharacterized protein n=1 Tax=Aureibacillus halotolerans TaxID=1508390 RepID=A0A4V3D4T5_9BACI|nr:hypothetical protein [Aureibacillus halotolerans]TDQ37477.1 hypothetical protein EV213_113112 [Aureibacillus halotolerans]
MKGLVIAMAVLWLWSFDVSQASAARSHEIPPVRMLHLTSGVEEVWANGELVQRASLRLFTSFTAYKKIDSASRLPRDGVLVRIPFMPPVVIDNTSFSGQVIQLVVVIPEEKKPWVLLKDVEGSWYECEMSSSVDELLLVLSGAVPN